MRRTAAAGFRRQCRHLLNLCRRAWRQLRGSPFGRTAPGASAAQQSRADQVAARYTENARKCSEH